MNNFHKALCVAFTAALLTTSVAVAAPRPIKAKLRSALGSGYTLVAVGKTNGAIKTREITGKSLSITPSESRASLYVIGPDNNVAYQVVNARCTKATRGKNKGKYTVCSKSTVNTVFKAGANLGTLRTLNGALRSTLTDSDYAKAVDTRVTASAVNYVPTGIKTFGLATQQVNVANVKLAAAGPLDEDSDGLVSALDSDDDGDGVLDNYDSDSTTDDTSFRLFSNLKLDIESSLNVNTGTLTTADIDAAMQNVQTLAISVLADATASEVSELDCGTLGYCSAGGTGRKVEGNSEFPGVAGSANDTDSDGYGEITEGTTGDFQLKTGATSTQIGAGDTLIQKVTSGSTTTDYAGILNFTFNTTPAVKTVTIGSTTNTIDYTVTTNRLGSRNNCIQAPASGDVILDIVGWRPQRPGVSSAGEGTYVDIGGSTVTIDIPNTPCSTPGAGCSGSGPGNCVASAYTVPSGETNLVTDANGLKDNAADQDTSATNTYNFVVNLSSCLNNAPGGAISWSSGQSLFVDLQFRSAYGDNAAQKFCVTRQ